MKTRMKRTHMDVATVKLDRRTVTGKKVKQLRRQGLIPVHVYGAGIEPANLQVDDRTLNRLLLQIGSNIPVSVVYEDQDEENICFVREVQRNPVTESVIHVDFLKVDVSRTVSTEVPLAIIGIAPAVTQMAGTLLQNVQSLLIEALPMDMPAEVPLDVSGLVDFDASVSVRDVQVPGNVIVLNNPDDVIARVAPPRLEVEIAEEDAEIDGLAEEGEEGEAAADDGSESAE
jgi:large subunit ribosomal protein L25